MTALDRFLCGNGDIGEILALQPELNRCLGSIDGFAQSERIERFCVPAVERLKIFGLVTGGMDETMAEYESGRCLQCDL